MKIAESLHRCCRAVGSDCVDFLFPPACCYCSQSLTLALNQSNSEKEIISQPQLCDACFSKLPAITNNHCLKCGAAQGPHILAKEGCLHCKNSRFSFSGAISLHLYEGDFRKMCWFCKQDSGQKLAWYLSHQLWESEHNRLKSWLCDAVVHVPMFWTRRLVRHVHPAESIASCLAMKLDIPFWHRALRQIRRVPHQAKLAASSRRKNVLGIYKTTRFHQFKDKSILLVDDILTTGTTASECAKVLKKAGAKQVHVAVLARGTGR